MSDVSSLEEDAPEIDGFDEKSEPVENLDDFDEDKAKNALEDLTADAQRCEGKLKREDLERLYFKRQLSPAECGYVEKNLKASGTVIEEVEDESEVLAIEGSLERTSDAMADFLRQAKKAPYLTETEEKECGRAIHLHLRAQPNVATTDKEEYSKIERRAHIARKRLVVSNLRWVAFVAMRHPVHGNFDLQDLIQEGILGLMRSTDKFDPEMGFRFKTYATWWIRQSMDRALKDKARTIRLPVHMHEKVRKLMRLRNNFISQNGIEPSYEELGKAMGIPAEQAASLLWFTDQSEVRSLDEDLGDDFSLSDTIKDNMTPDPHQITEEKELHRILTNVLSTLTPRQEEILRSRFGLDLPSTMTLEELGKRYGITRERIRQIEAKALLKLAKKIPIKNLRKWFQGG